MSKHAVYSFITQEPDKLKDGMWLRGMTESYTYVILSIEKNKGLIGQIQKPHKSRVLSPDGPIQTSLRDINLCLTDFIGYSEDL